MQISYKHNENNLAKITGSTQVFLHNKNGNHYIFYKKFEAVNFKCLKNNNKKWCSVESVNFNKFQELFL